MEEKGEFEARPEARSAESVALPRAKASPVTKILCFVFALIAVGLGAFILYDKVINPFIGKVHPCPEKFEMETDKTAETIKKVKQIIVDERVMMIKFADENGSEYVLDQRYDDNPPSYDFEEGYSTSLEASFGLSFRIEPTERHFELEEKNDLDGKVRTILENHGLKKTASSAAGYVGEVDYYSSEDGYICVFTPESSPLYLDCGHTSWLSQAKKDLVKQLADAYKRGVETSYAVVYVDADPEEIETSPNGEYQRIYGGLDNAGVLFYRKGSDGEWKYFTATQQALGCDQYDTDELKAAFEGRDCYDYENNKSSTVK
jgi:hypothetical protein